MRQIKVLVERGWEIEINMSADHFFYIGADHATWGEAQGCNRNLNEAIKQMFAKAKKLEEDWR